MINFNEVQITRKMNTKILWQRLVCASYAKTKRHALRSIGLVRLVVVLSTSIRIVFIQMLSDADAVK